MGVINMKKQILLFLLLITAGLMFAQVKNKLIFVCEEYPPYEYTQNGVSKGLDIEIIELICKEAKIPFEIQFYPWARCMQMIKQGNADVIFGILKNEERKSFLKYPDQNVSFDKRVIISKKDSKLKISSLNDLKSQTVGVVRDYAYEPNFDKSTLFSRDFSTSSNLVIDKLKADRFPLIALNESVAKFMIGDKEWNNYKVHPYVITQDPLYTAFALNSKNAMSWFDQYNETMTKLYKKGEIQKIWNKYR